MKAAPSENVDLAEIAAWEQAGEHLVDYLRNLGVNDPSLVQSLAADCLSRARNRVSTGSVDDLLRRAIEEAQRHMDASVAKLLGLSPTRDAHKIAEARAALLFRATGQSTDFLFGAPDTEQARVPRLKASLPVPTPPEAPIAMPVQKIDFLFFKST